MWVGQFDMPYLQRYACHACPCLNACPILQPVALPYVCVNQHYRKQKRMARPGPLTANPAPPYDRGACNPLQCKVLQDNVQQVYTLHPNTS